MFFWPNLQNIDVSLLLRRWSLMILRRDIFETLVFSIAPFLIFIVFVLLNSESLMFHCCFIDDSLMILWRTVDDTTKICMQTLKIIEVSNVIFIRSLVFFAAWLINRSWSYEEFLIRFWFLMISIVTLMTKSFFCANLENIDNSLPLPVWFCDDALERFC